MADNPAITQETIDRIRRKKEIVEQTSNSGMSDCFDRYMDDLLNHADALLKAASFGLRSEKFFREMGGMSATKKNTGWCTDGCFLWNSCLRGDMCILIAKYVKDAGLWPKGE